MFFNVKQLEGFATQSTYLLQFLKAANSSVICTFKMHCERKHTENELQTESLT